MLGGKVGRQAGGGGSRAPEHRDPSLPSQAQGSQGCRPEALDGVPNPSPLDLVASGRWRRVRWITGKSVTDQWLSSV